MMEEVEMKSDRYYQMRAEEIRTLRDAMRDPKARAIMSRIAAGYERLGRMPCLADRQATLLRVATDYAELTDGNNGNAYN